MPEVNLPAWAEELKKRYLRSEASMFVLHGNVYDSVLSGGKLIALSDFLANVLLKESRETIALYNLATGVRFTKRAKDAVNILIDELLGTGQKDKVFAALERLVTQSK